MKKILSIVLCFMMLTAIAPVVNASEGIPVYLDGEPIEKEGMIISDSTYLPVRALCEAINISVKWDDETKSVILGDDVESPQKSDTVNIYLNGKLIENSEAVIVDGSTYLPVRALCEALGMDVEWNNEKREVYVSSPKSDAPLNGNYYKLKHVKTGFYLSVEHANQDDGAKIVVAALDNSNSNQIWGFSYMDDGCYKVFNQNTKKSIDVAAFSTVAGTPLTQYTTNGGTNQQIRPVLNEDGTYTLTFRHSNLAITATERYTTQEELTGDDSQAFVLEYVGRTPMGNIKESDGYKALDEKTRERFDTYVYTTLPFGARVQSEVENKLIVTDYYNLTADEQANVLKDCLKITVYGQVDFGQIKPDTKKAEYEIVSKTYQESYDVWRGTMLPVWMYEVKMAGDTEGQEHNWTMVSTVEDSPVVTNAINAISRFPYAIRHHINRLVYREDVANSYNGGGDTIWIRITWKPNEDQIAHTLSHELGHVLDTNLTSDTELWNRAIKEDGVPMSSYGNSNREEDLAEFSRMYNLLRTDEDALKEVEKVYPNRFAAYAALLFASDSRYYAKYSSYYENAMKFDDDDEEPFYCSISIPGTNLALTANNYSDRGSVLTFEENTGAENQIWRIRAWQGKKAIFNKASGMCVNVPGNSTESGKNLILWNGGKGSNELVTMTLISNNTYTLQFAHSSLYLGNDNATAVQTNSKTNLLITQIK